MESTLIKTKRKRKLSYKNRPEYQQTMEVDFSGELTTIPQISMVPKYRIFDENDPNFKWPLKGEQYNIPQSSLEPTYKMFDENISDFKFPLKVM